MSTLTKPTDEQTTSLQAWRAAALDKMPYMANVLFSLRVLNAPGLGTFAVDGHYRMYIDFEHIATEGWTTGNCAEALLHECSHLLQDHRVSAEELGVGAAEHGTWNVAGDMAINDDLVEAGCTFLGEIGMMPAKINEPNGKTPHHYYAVLRKLQEQNKKPDPQPGDGSGGSGAPSEGQGSPGDSSGQGQGQDSGPFKGCGSGSGGEAAPGELGEADDLNGAAPAASSTERERIKINTAAAISDHIATKGRGSVPGGMVELAEQTLTPSKTPWQQILRACVRRAFTSQPGLSKTDPARRHRRRHRQEIISRTGASTRRMVVPGSFDPKPRIEVIRDTSGSMNESDLADVTNEVEALARRMGVRGKDLMVTDVDAEIGASRGYNGAKSMAEITGRGGTDMRVGIEAAAERGRNRPSVIVVATDGGTPWPQEPCGIPVVAAIVGTPEQVESIMRHNEPPSWIQTVTVDRTADQ